MLAHFGNLNDLAQALAIEVLLSLLLPALLLSLAFWLSGCGAVSAGLWGVGSSLVLAATRFVASWRRWT